MSTPDKAGTVVLVEIPRPGVALIRINRPDKLNALNLELRQALAEMFTSLSEDEATRAIVVTGDEHAFVAGADLAEFTEVDAIGQMLRATERYWEPIRLCPKPVIAAVRGFALGGGMELALHADIIVAGHSARFAQSEPTVGLMTGAGGSQRLMRAVGKYNAMRLLLTAERITGAEAWRIGLVSDLVDDDKVVDHAVALGERIAAMPPLAMRQIKEVALAGADAPLEMALRLERKAFQLLFDSADKREGLAAFMEKRKPTFRGC